MCARGAWPNDPNNTIVAHWHMPSTQRRPLTHVHVEYHFDFALFIVCANSCILKPHGFGNQAMPVIMGSMSKPSIRLIPIYSINLKLIYILEYK